LKHSKGKLDGAGKSLGVHGRWLPVMLAIVVRSTAAQAHSASDAYLTLTVDSGHQTRKLVIHGQWDIALRDLDFVMTLDDDGNGRLTWGELRHHQPAIERYAYPHLAFNTGLGTECAIKPTRQMVDDHADGAYAALFFDVVCENVSKKLALRYDLFFAIDPSHRGIFVLHSGADTATAVLSPENAKIDLNF
jgi:hypothetical protein